MSIIGRRACPWCGFEHAHVKQNEGKLPYHHCPNCGLMTQSKNGHQAQMLKKGMGPIDALKIPEPPPTDQPIVYLNPPKPAPVAAPAPPATPKKPAGLWDSLMGKKEE